MADAYGLYQYYKKKYNYASDQKSTSQRREEEYILVNTWPNRYYLVFS